MKAVDLPPDYYLSNFLSLVNFVADRYTSLLSPGEKTFYDSFQSVDPDAQKLYVRLLSRKGQLFRRSKLSYSEIDSIETAAQILAGAGLLDIDPVVEPAVLVPLFSKAELLALCVERGELKTFRTLGRGALEKALLVQAESVGLRLSGADTVYRINGEEAFTTFKLCYFGNLRQDLTDYVLRDLGLQTYERYSLEQRHLLFQSRAQIERHLQYYRCAEQLDTVIGADADTLVDFHAGLPAKDRADKTLSRRLDRLTLTLARQLERLDALDQADMLYRACERPPARERRARLAAKQGRPAAALAFCRDILAAPRSEEELTFAGAFGYRIARRHGDDWPQPPAYQVPTKTVVLAAGPASVEWAAAEYLAAEGRCFYVENTLFNGVLGLFIWDIVFAPVAGAFFNPFQTAPGDFYEPDFHIARAELLQARFEQLSGPAFTDTVKRNFRHKRGIANPLVAWQYLSEELIDLALTRIPAAHWEKIFRRQLAELRNNRAGLPDLVLFPPDSGYELVEVKGPGDRLQKNQLRWMCFFAEHNIAHRVLAVEWGDCA
ncbi:VRR-NUC domain-containing protein [Exilibacterium tricleocarpae]|uniref:phosphodiesterase I n=1 Tax=Exilibacterium tricleocarpae TaxID=2591008 RepID=A0A545SYR9_9GAMM|nr:VRR-NUC domain-containing protein [Exilibacterium tricleocarpae]TQV70110.1 VRR-NUC domain-containing protein [Exilibacterium tricleocarpae]